MQFSDKGELAVRGCGARGWRRGGRGGRGHDQGRELSRFTQMQLMKIIVKCFGKGK